MFKKLKSRTPRLLKNKLKLVLFVVLCVAILFSFTIVPLQMWMSSGIYTFGITSIRGDSMSPTIENNGLLYMQPVEFERGEIVVASCPSTTQYTEAAGVQLLKRIVGLPGETLEITEEGITVDGVLLEENYIDTENKTLRDTNDINEIILSDGEYFLVGDNRVNSFDSRHVGAIHQTEFLYGLTLEPNDYTYSLWAKAALIAIVNLVCIIVLPILIFMCLTAEKHVLSDSGRTVKAKDVCVSEAQDLAQGSSIINETVKPKKSQPKSKKNQKKAERAKKRHSIK